MQVELNEQALEVLNLVVSLLIPIAVAVVTKQWAPSRVKTGVLVLLAALLAVLTALLDSGTFVPWDAVMLFVQNVVVAVAVHVGVLKPAGITGAEGAAARILPHTGVGKEHLDQ